MTLDDLTPLSSNLLLGTAVGAGVAQSLFVMPGWFEALPESLAAAQARPAFKAFWIPLQLGTGAALIAATVRNRRDPRRARPLGAALALYVATWAATGAYFAPEVLRLARGQVPGAEAPRRARRWQGLTWLRHAALAGAWVLTAVALGRR